jgi:Zn-dependent protease with chaperone function
MLGLVGRIGGVIGLVTAVAMPFLCQAWMLTSRPIRLLRSRAARGSVANIVDAAVIAFGLDTTAVAAVVVDTPVLNCGAFPSRRNSIVVWVTTGLVEALDRAQLEAVLFAQVAIAKDPRIRRGAANEALLRLMVVPSYAVLFILPFIASYSMSDAFLEALVLAFFAPFVTIVVFWNKAKFTLARIKAADAIAAATTLLPDALTSAFDLIAERTTEVRYRITLAALVDPFALTATGAETKRTVGNRVAASGTGTERALLAARAAYLRGLLNGSDKKFDLTGRIYAETAALEGTSYEDESRDTWHTKPTIIEPGAIAPSNNWPPPSVT